MSRDPRRAEAERVAWVCVRSFVFGCLLTNALWLVSPILRWLL